ncbi:MAG: SIMPL domain-containing protein [Pseudomonadota bacterium]
MKLSLIALATAISLATPLALVEVTSASEITQPKISVSGTGMVSVSPDMAIVSLGVVREADTARKALIANNEAMASVLDAMKSNGIAEKDLQTSNFSIQPRFHYPKRKSNGEQPPPVITGYIVSNKLDVRIRDLSQTGEILDLAVTLGMNEGGNIRFTNDDATSILKEAREKAVKDAIAKAETLTSASSVGLGDILAISEQGSQPRPMKMAQARAMALESDAASVPIAGGENSYRVTVNITWEIDQ